MTKRKLEYPSQTTDVVEPENLQEPTKLVEEQGVFTIELAASKKLPLTTITTPSTDDAKEKAAKIDDAVQSPRRLASDALIALRAADSSASFSGVSKVEDNNHSSSDDEEWKQFKAKRDRAKKLQQQQPVKDQKKRKLTRHKKTKSVNPDLNKMQSLNIPHKSKITVTIEGVNKELKYKPVEQDEKSVKKDEKKNPVVLAKSTKAPLVEHKSRSSAGSTPYNSSISFNEISPEDDVLEPKPKRPQTQSPKKCSDYCSIV